MLVFESPSSISGSEGITAGLTISNTTDRRVVYKVRYHRQLQSFASAYVCVCVCALFVCLWIDVSVGVSSISGLEGIMASITISNTTDK